ncbi:MAG: DUF4159 domain-containing protein [Acidobacteria bacterium]|nr:MAG: DUF4159 domain-containing protein [Acidobacteriota bacterium]
MGRRTVRMVLATLLVLAAATAYAQFRGGGFGFRRIPPRLPKADSFDGRYNFCRLMYQSAYREAGGQGWSTDYPDADINFSIRLGELTKTPVNFDKRGEPNFLVVPIMNPALFRCPWAIVEDAGSMWLEEEEVGQLRNYLLKGGFLWIDDFWGSRAWDNWSEQIGRVLPPGQYPIIDIPHDHVIFRTLFEVERIPQIPSIQFWRQSSGSISERGQDSAEVHFRAITDERGRIMVLMTHNTDIADGWEREGEDPRYFYAFSPDSYAVAINVMMYMMSH